ncbi:response regulator [Paenibacillus sp. 1P07SE]|uniref:response regulator n=1 Tax=Paenibacillus sp. 1P07SE TaxID=3132209 RepID=UPI0039A687A9
MYVLIIEDEPQALEGLKRIMEQLDPRIKQAFFCDRAAAAMHIIEEHRPELIVTDIILPDSTGLDLLEQIQYDGYEPKVIIVSGFDDFDYAKRGMQLGAVDYFLKPFDTRQFCEKIRDCLNWIEEEQQDRLAHNRAVELAHLGTRSMRDLFLIGLCMQPTYLQEHIVHRLRTWGLEWLSQAPYTIIALAARAAVAELSEKEEDLLSFATGNIVEEVLLGYAPSLTFKNSKKQWIIVTPLEDIRPLLAMLGREIRTYQKVEGRFGVSERMVSFQGLHTAYRQAMDCLRAALLSDEEEVMAYEQLKPHLADLEVDITAYMTRAIRQGDEQLIRTASIMFVRSLVVKGDAARPSEISQRCMDWIMQLQSELRSSAEGVSTAELGEIPVSLWDEMDACRSVDEMSRTVARFCNVTAWKLKGMSKNSFIEQALRRIHGSYTCELKLQDLADELSLHPVWLSQLFKKEVGTNFLDYVTELRIQRAKELLRQSSSKVYEIAEAVGYHDVHHFGRLFKKKTGLTPKEYRYGK